MTEFDKVIHPGGVGKITASIHTTSLKGEVTKSVTVTTNDPTNRTFVLSLKANVVVPIEVQPSDMVSFDGKAGKLQPTTVRVVAGSGEAFDILSAESSDPHFKVSVARNLVANYSVTITPSADVPIGRGNALVTLKTSSPKAAEVIIRITTHVRGEVEVLPERVTLRLGASQPETAKVQHVAIRKREGAPLEILGVESSNKAIKTTLKTIQEGQEYDLEVRYDGAPPTAVVNADVTIKTSDPIQSAIKVTVYGFPEAQALSADKPGSVETAPIPAKAKAQPK